MTELRTHRSFALVSPVSAQSRSGGLVSKLGGWKTACALFLLCAATAIVSPAQTFTNLASFDGTDGSKPEYMSLIQGADGNLYGTTSAGGEYSQGAIFRITPGATSQTPDILYSFCATPNTDGYCPDGANPYGGLVQAADGSFYGTTLTGGSSTINGGDDGTIFRFLPSATPPLTTIYNFCTQTECSDGAFPYAALILGTDGNLYGTTYEGGTGHSGTVFKIKPSSSPTTPTTLYNFCTKMNSQEDCLDGAYPISGVVQATNGMFYGTTSYTLFQTTAAGNLKTLYPFCTGTGCDTFDGPYGTLIQGTDGNLYGTTSGGGANDNGSVFQFVISTRTLNTLHSFCDLSSCNGGNPPTDGGNPTGTLVQGTDGNLYGTTQYGGANSGHGMVFSIATTVGTPTPLYNFCSQPACADGSQPAGGLVQDTNGTFYGTTWGGGTSQDGTVFSLSVGLGSFVETRPTSGKVGAKVTILGNGLTGATSVSFNGTAATITVDKSSQIKTTVPTGATTGTVEVTTAKGKTLKSNVVFQVTP